MSEASTSAVDVAEGRRLLELLRDVLDGYERGLGLAGHALWAQNARAVMATLSVRLPIIITAAEQVAGMRRALEECDAETKAIMDAYTPGEGDDPMIEVQRSEGRFIEFVRSALGAAP